MFSKLFIRLKHKLAGLFFDCGDDLDRAYSEPIAVEKVSFSGEGMIGHCPHCTELVVFSKGISTAFQELYSCPVCYSSFELDI